jgi:predicted transcriptional regulator
MAITIIAIKGVKDCEFVNYWANVIPLRRLLMQEDDLFIDELHLLAYIYKLSVDTGKPILKSQLVKGFNILSYKRDKMLQRLLDKGFLTNDRKGDTSKVSGFKLILSPLGEQLLIKYEKAMRKLCEGSK